jgi:hypothetical protein
MRILRVVASARLPCGCLVGVYETYDGAVAHLIDYRDPGCRDSTHRSGAVVREEMKEAVGKPEPSSV